MKIALSFPGCHRRGGVERVFVECLNFLASRGHEVHALASEWDHKALVPEIVCHEVPTRALLPAHRIEKFRRRSEEILSRLKPDVSGSFGVASPSGSVVWMQSVHAAWIEISRQTRPFSGRLKQQLNLFHPMILRMERALLRGRRYRKVIALTAAVQQDLERFYAVPAGDIAVLPNGYSQAEFNPVHRLHLREVWRRKLRYTDEHRVIVFVANEAERKGLLPLLRAIAMQNDASLRLLIVGRINPEPIGREAARLNLRDRIHFAGPSDNAADYYAAADVFALPTKYEAWGLVIIEALACGLPVLTSRLAGAAVAVKEGSTGYLLDQPADEQEIARQLTRLLKLRADAAMIATSVEPYSWSHILTRYENVLMAARS